MLGDAVFRQESAAATARDTTIVDQACFPVALLALVAALRALRLLVIPILSYAVSIGVAFLFMRGSPARSVALPGRSRSVAGRSVVAGRSSQGDRRYRAVTWLVP